VVSFPTADEVSHEAQRETALNWYYELELLAAARNLLEVHKVDGLLLVASFACGTGASDKRADSARGRPPSQSTDDTGVTGRAYGRGRLVTRVESFVDLLRLRKR